MGVIEGREYLGHMGFVKWMDIEFISFVETQGKMVLYFSLEKLFKY